MPGGDIKQLLGGVQLITANLMRQGVARCVGPEYQDEVGVGHPRELMALLREAPIVISKGFARLLLATL
jgi:hypothetical protein